ncbi:MAG: DUF1697 domain-containing protein [Polyangiaceae bacterium]
MPRRVAFLGSINVGGHRVTMVDLKRAFEDLGTSDVWTFIASGNVVFTSTKVLPEATLEKRLTAALGFPVTVFLRTEDDVRRLAKACPFEVTSKHTHHVAMLRSAPGKATKRALEAISNATDTIVVDGAELHWRIVGKSLDTTIQPRVLARTLGGPMTARNVTSIRKFAAKLDG